MGSGGNQTAYDNTSQNDADWKN